MSSPSPLPKPTSTTAAAASSYAVSLSLRACVYLPRLPPMLTVTKLKTLLAPLAEPTRVYFQKEDKSVSKRRKQAGGSGARRFTEGWVEFVDKKTAKRVARTLHMTNMEKKGRHADDLWCLKYLPKFTWSMLTERVAYERRTRDARLRKEAMEAGKEVKRWKEGVEAGQKFDMMRKKKRKREGV